MKKATCLLAALVLPLPLLAQTLSQEAIWLRCRADYRIYKLDINNGQRENETTETYSDKAGDFYVFDKKRFFLFVFIKMTSGLLNKSIRLLAKINVHWKFLHQK